MHDLQTLYAGTPLVLWVEDSSIQAFLTAMWSEPRIRILAAEAPIVPALVEGAWAGGPGHVFGAVGRGFGSDNRHRWARPPATLGTYVATVFDLRAWLFLDDDPPPDDGQCLWMASRHLLADTSRAATAGLPSAGDLEGILASGWFSTVAHDLPDLADPEWVRGEHERLVGEYRAACSSSRWRAVFPGPSLSMDEARRRADALRAADQIPGDALALRDSLLGRIS